ncbi:hypothetical protein V6O07_18830, partial [Arthrospira platensis SPKY2]
GQDAESQGYFEKAIALYRQIGDGYSVAAQTANYGWAMDRTQRKEEAQRYFALASDLYAKIGFTAKAEEYRKRAEQYLEPISRA